MDADLRSSWRTQTVQWAHQWWAAHGTWKQSARRPAGSGECWLSAWPSGTRASPPPTASQSMSPATEQQNGSKVWGYCGWPPWNAVHLTQSCYSFWMLSGNTLQPPFQIKTLHKRLKHLCFQLKEVKLSACFRQQNCRNCASQSTDLYASIYENTSQTNSLPPGWEDGCAPQLAWCRTGQCSAPEPEQQKHPHTLVSIKYGGKILDHSHLFTHATQRPVLFVQSRNTCRTRKQHSLSEEQEQFSLGAEGFPSEHGQVLQGHAWPTVPQNCSCKQISKQS